MADQQPYPVALPGSLRERFPIFRHATYVNSCSQGALSDAVREAYATYLREWEELGSPWELWVERVEDARGAFARLLGASADEIAVTTSLSHGVSSLLSGLRFDGERRRIVLSDVEFPTVGQIAHAQELRGAEVVHVLPAAGGPTPPERFAEAIDERTALVAFPHVSYCDGSRTDVAAIAGLARERGALVLLDAYQSAGALPLDVGALGVDFLAAGSVKYLLGSPGLGFLFCRRELVERIVPTVTGWFADKDPAAMDGHRYSPARNARRFQAGTPPVPNVYAGIAGLELVLGVGVERTAAHVFTLCDRLIAGLDELGASPVTPLEPSRRGPMVAVRATDAEALVAALRGEAVIASARSGNLRISLHFYNGPEDVDAVLAALARHRSLLAGG
jgi:selenocysteine lyase/cysteine desulfurase